MSKNYLQILCLFALVISACTGSKKYFKAAERLEKQGLINEAADYYLVSLQRKPTNVDARIKLKEVGQKYISNLSSDFFRNFNTQELEASLNSFERLKDFYSKTKALNVELDYPKTYDDDYLKAVDMYCEKNYNEAIKLLHDKRYDDAATFTARIKKYNNTYKNTAELDIKATCEPSYQRAITAIENKNYSIAYDNLSNIRLKTDQYKDANELFELCKAKQTRGVLIIQPSLPNDRAEESVEQVLFGKFNQVCTSYNTIKVLNNTPFQANGNFNDLSNSTNVDLIQAIRKASGTEYIYTYDLSNIRENTSGLSKTPGRAYREVRVKVNDSTYTTEYKPVDYNTVKQDRTFAYDFKYKVINAGNGQVVSSGLQTLRGYDNVNYSEFLRPYEGNINSLFPNNAPSNNSIVRIGYNAWRNTFSARSSLKSMDELRNDVFTQTMAIFKNSINIMK
jgi:hypothetical protein